MSFKIFINKPSFFSAVGAGFAQCINSEYPNWHATDTLLRLSVFYLKYWVGPRNLSALHTFLLYFISSICVLKCTFPLIYFREGEELKCSFMMVLLK